MMAMRKRIAADLAAMRVAGTYKKERLLTRPQAPRTATQTQGPVLNMCANNYLGLANDDRWVPRVPCPFCRCLTRTHGWAPSTRHALRRCIDPHTQPGNTLRCFCIAG